MEEGDSSSPVTKPITESSDACPTEHAIRALLENLVDPLLPFKPSPSDVPSKALKESVAKQVHAVVLLYNYYHRKDHTHLDCLSLESFRSLTTGIRPALMQHFQDSGDSEQTLLLEKVIVDACSLATSLDESSSDLAILKKWPIRKVAVLLVDSKKSSCYLQHSSITQGVWSLLEKSIEKEKSGDQNEEVLFQKVVFTAIKEATGVHHKDIVILERHLVSSLSEEKTTARFYIMKCTSENNFPGDNPIEDVLNFVQGSLFDKSFSEWTVNSKVEYFHVLPFASLIADWFSRREEAEFVIEKEAEALGEESNGRADASRESEVSDIFGEGANASSKKRNDTNAKKYPTPLTNPKGRKNAPPRMQNRKASGRLETVFGLKARHVDNETSPYKGSNSNGERGGWEVESDSEHQRERDIQRRKAIADKFKSKSKLNAPNSNLNLEELQTTLLSSATSLYDTALKVLLCKRDQLTLQQRNIEDEIAKCDKCIQNIKGDIELQLETILECCNETYPRRILQQSPDKSACQSNKRVKLSEPLSPTNSLCQKLDNFCLEHNWALPNYSVSLSDGGFGAEVRMKEAQFEYKVRGEEKSDAEEARESAAAGMLTKLYRNTSANFS